MRTKILSVILVMLVGARFCVAPLGAQSLAALAKQEEERRKAITKPTKVLTNRDLTAAPPSSAPAAAAPSAKAAADDADDDKADASKGASKSDGAAAPKAIKDKAYWSGRQNDLQSGLSRDQTYADALQARINSLNADFVNRDDPAQRAVVATQRQKATDELSRLTKQIATERKALADLQEEARKAGVPAGWLR